MNRVKEEGLVALTILATAGVLCTIFQQTIGDFILVSVVAYGISAVSRVYARKQEAERAADRMRVDEIVRRVNDRLIVKGDDLSAEEIRTQEEQYKKSV